MYIHTCNIIYSIDTYRWWTQIRFVLIAQRDMIPYLSYHIYYIISIESYLLYPPHVWIIPLTIADAGPGPFSTRHPPIFTLGSHPQWGAGGLLKGAKSRHFAQATCKDSHIYIYLYVCIYIYIKIWNYISMYSVWKYTIY